jgi:hypothetical protein
MKRILLIPATIGCLAALGGCVPMMAAKAVGMAASGARTVPASNAHLAPAAEAACRQLAAPHGTVHVIDVEQSRANRIIVWGTSGEGAQKQSFECHFGTAVTAFKLRPITPR